MQHREKDRYIVADGADGWEVWRYAGPWWDEGPFEVIASGLTEDEADALVTVHAEGRQALN